MIQWGKISFVTLYTLLFSLLIFVGKEIFFPSAIIAERYMEPDLGYDFTNFDHNHPHEYEAPEEYVLDEATKSRIYEEFKSKYNQKQQDKLSIYFIPEGLRKIVEFSYLPIAEMFFYSPSILKRITDMNVVIYDSESDTRGRMRGGDIFIYGLRGMRDGEFLSVLIHEFAHYYDIYSLKGNAFGDTSTFFYDISWQATNEILPGQGIGDFVSGYAMTNKYEDFAESYLYYVLHNKDFIEKSESSIYLRKKYDFFEKYVFSSESFSGKDFGGEDELEDYYWDVTKIPVNVKKFLQYMQDSI